ncbi:MAG: hypothetical protein AAGD07_20210 [Planctomycetota bacterium]
MAKVTVDIAGFYYSTEFDNDAIANPTVQQATEGVVNQVGANGRGKLLKAEFNSGGFLNEIAVVFTPDNPPLSRQLKSDGTSRSPEGLPPGLYRYRDEPGKNANSCDGLSNSLTLAWQYYVFRQVALEGGGTARALVNGGTGTERRIVAAGQFELQDNDLLRWRLIAIGGIIEATPESALMSNMIDIVTNRRGALSTAALPTPQE